MSRPAEHDFLVIAPWWKWGEPPDPGKGRVSAPVFQKYDSSDLVNTFIKDPQRALKFGRTDWVHVPTPADKAPPSAKPLRFSDTVYAPAEPPTRKLFLDTHKRFYLVVCQVSCDMPGLPRASRDKICQVRFVVRRRTTRVPSAHVETARQALRELGTARAQRRKLEAAWAGLRAGAAPKSSDRALRLAAAKRASIEERRASVQARVSSERQRLLELVDRLGLSVQLQGWFPSPSGAAKVGFWDTVEETPDDPGDEDTFPMYPLIPPRSEPDHSGQFGTIYFGLVPTGSHDMDDAGEPRFDDQSLYEVRCFVKRHKQAHGANEPCPCPDGLFWSPPTQPYRLAAHFDLVGTGQRPVTIQLPNMDELAAQAAPALGARFVKPPGSLMVQGAKDGTIGASGRGQIPEICFIPIPLITIVAMFVFELFLPVVMLVFGLFWMLKLKFCIPPQIDVAAGITAEISLDTSLDASLQADIQLNVKAGLDPSGTWPVPVPAPPRPPPIDTPLSQALLSGYSPIALGNLAFDAKLAADTVQGTAGATAPAVSLSGDLEWEAEVTFA